MRGLEFLEEFLFEQVCAICSQADGNWVRWVHNIYFLFTAVYDLNDEINIVEIGTCLSSGADIHCDISHRFVSVDCDVLLIADGQSLNVDLIRMREITLFV